MTPQLFSAIQSIKRIVHETCKRHDVRFHDRKESPNPFYHQTAAGLLIVDGYSTFTELYTPLGSYELGGSCSAPSGANFKRVTAELVERFGCVCIREMRQESTGLSPALYTVAHVDGVELPAYSPRASKHSGPDSDYIPYDVARSRWAELVQDSRQ